MLDLFGITDIVNCVTKGDVGACAMTLVSFLPIGKILQAGKAIALIGKLLPKVAEFFGRRQAAVRTIEKYATVAVCALGAIVASTLAVPQAKGLVPVPAAAAADGSCSLPPKNPALSGSKKSNLLGQWGEAAAGLAGKKKEPFFDESGKKWIPDGTEGANLVESKNVPYLSDTKQLKAYTAQAQKNGGILTIWTRPDTQLSQSLKNKLNNGSIKVEHFPDSLP